MNPPFNPHTPGSPEHRRIYFRTLLGLGYGPYSIDQTFSSQLQNELNQIAQLRELSSTDATRTQQLNWRRSNLIKILEQRDIAGKSK